MPKDKKVILVSGGSKGLGKGISESLLENGYTVVTFSRSKTDAIEEMEKLGDKCFYWSQVNAKNSKELKALVTDVYRKFRRIDGLVNNVGATLDALLPLTTDEQVADNIALNLQSVILLSRNVSRVMIRQQSGCIVNISSILGSRGFKGVSVYSATKSALDGFSSSLARELGAKNIRVNSIAPGFLATDMTHGMAEGRKAQIIRRTPLGRLGEIEDVVPSVLFLLSEESKFITGQTLTIDGGLTC